VQEIFFRTKCGTSCCSFRELTSYERNNVVLESSWSFLDHDKTNSVNSYWQHFKQCWWWSMLVMCNSDDRSQQWPRKSFR